MAVLLGLKEYADTLDITAIVAMADSGGSTGRLHDELGVLPPGDIRKCLIALADDASVMRQLFEYRFETAAVGPSYHAQADNPAQNPGLNTGLTGHSFGNLFLSALEKVTGSLPAAIEEASRILRVRGTVIPVTTDKTDIAIHTKTDQHLVGEHYLDDEGYIREHGITTTHLTNSPTLNPRAHDALATADCIVFGPGDVYGSILPCLQVHGLREAIQENTRAHKVLVVNTTNKPGLTSSWRSSDYLTCVESYIGAGSITHCIANNEQPPAHLAEKYTSHYGEDVLVVCDSLPHSCAPIYTHLLKHYPHDAGEQFIRHDEHRLAEQIVRIL